MATTSANPPTSATSASGASTAAIPAQAGTPYGEPKPFRRLTNTEFWVAAILMSAAAVAALLSFVLLMSPTPGACRGPGDPISKPEPASCTPMSFEAPAGPGSNIG